MLDGVMFERYCLYLDPIVSYSHRCRLVHSYLKLQNIIPVCFTDPMPTEAGIVFSERYPDELNSCDTLAQIYNRDASMFGLPAKLPMLWDAKDNKVVSNDSYKIMQLLNTMAQQYQLEATVNLFPLEYQSEINHMMHQIHTVNCTPYAVQAAQTQTDYDMSLIRLFSGLGCFIPRLHSDAYLVGNQLTLADFLLYPTLARFDPIYYRHFRCRITKLRNIKVLFEYYQRLQRLPGIKQTYDPELTRQCYQHLFTRPEFVPTYAVSQVSLRPVAFKWRREPNEKRTPIFSVV